MECFYEVKFLKINREVMCIMMIGEKCIVFCMGKFKIFFFKVVV